MSDPVKAKDESDENEEDSYRLYTTKKTTYKHEIYLSSGFENPEEYQKIFHLLDHAGKDDEITFYLNSYGGRVDTGIQFGSKLAKTKATTKTIVEAPSYSMGAIFPFMTDSFEMNPHTFLMWHDASGGSFGKMNEQELRITTFNKLFKQILQDYCSSVLKAAEIADILKGRDVYLTDKEIVERLSKKKGK